MRKNIKREVKELERDNKKYKYSICIQKLENEKHTNLEISGNCEEAIATGIYSLIMNILDYNIISKDKLEYAVDTALRKIRGNNNVQVHEIKVNKEELENVLKNIIGGKFNG